MQSAAPIVKIDPATNASIQEYLDCFVPDPAMRLVVEEVFTDAAIENPYTSHQSMEDLRRITQIFKHTTDKSVRVVLQFSQNAALLTVLKAYRDKKRSL
jgi:hypothetical protein